MILKGMQLGMFGSNCYIVGCEETREAAIIDPGAEPDRILRLVEEERLVVKYIINTHGHIDHIGGNARIKEKTGAEILIHQKDARMLTDPLNYAMLPGRKQVSPKADRLLQDGDIIKVGRTVELEVIHTPGHTQGGICLKTGNIIFSGDTLFAASIGRTDFPGGSYKTLIESINNRLMGFDDDTVVYPGHMQATTIGFERKHNPFL